MQVKEELGEVRIVAEGALARRSVLEDQIKRAREQVKALVEKSEQDDALIIALHGRLDASGRGYALLALHTQGSQDETPMQCSTAMSECRSTWVPSLPHHLLNVLTTASMLALPGCCVAWDCCVCCGLNVPCEPVLPGPRLWCGQLSTWQQDGRGWKRK